MDDAGAGPVGAEREATERLFGILYSELRKLAAYHLRRERPGHTLQTTALVHEAYLRLAGQEKAQWKNREHFFSVAALAMRRVLVDHARRRRAAKRGDGIAPSSLDFVTLPVDDSIEVLELDLALDKLAAVEPREARIVELRFFAGLSVPEVALVLGVSESTVERDWVTARAWLRRELSGGGASSGPGGNGCA